MNAVALAAAFRAWPSGMNRDQSTGHHSRSSTQLSPCHHAGANGDKIGCAVWESRSECVSSYREASLQTSSPTPGTPPQLSQSSRWELQRQCHTPRVVGLRRPQLQRASSLATSRLKLVAFVSLLLLSKFSVLKLHIEGCLFDLLGTISTTPCTDSLTRCSSRDGHLALWQSPSDCLQPQSASRADNTNFAIGCQDGPGCSVRRARKTTPLLSPRRLRHAAASLVKDFKSS